MKKFFATLFFLLTIQSFPQDFAKLYKNHIPDNIKVDKILSNSLSMNLKRNALLQPELIYLTLKYYQQYDGSKFDTKLFEVLKMNERVWFLQRNDWVNDTKEKLFQNENFELVSLTEQSLNDLIVDVRIKDNDLLSVLNMSEINLRDFYIVKYYNNDPDLKYDPNISYSDIRADQERVKLRYFENAMGNPKLVTSTQDFLKKIIDNWYLFSENKELEAAGVLIDCIDSENISKNRKHFSIFLGGVFINKIINLNEDIKFPDLDRKITMSTESSLPQFSFGVGYKFYFKKNSNYFSFIDFQLFYSIGYSSIDENYPYRYENLEYTSTQTVRELISSSSNYKLSSFNSLGVKIATPFYKLDFLSFELALNTSWDSYWFDPDIVFSHSKIRSNSAPPFNSDTLANSQVKLQSPKTKHQLAFMPMIDANLRIEDGFNARISFGYGYFNMGVVYSTSLFKD